MINKSYIDPLLELNNTQPGFFNNLVKIYEKTSVELIDSMKYGLKNGNFEIIKKSAHSLKSSSLTLGLEEVSKLSLSLEKQSSEEGSTVVNMIIEKLENVNQVHIDELKKMSESIHLMV